MAEQDQNAGPAGADYGDGDEPVDQEVDMGALDSVFRGDNEIQEDETPESVVEAVEGGQEQSEDDGAAQESEGEGQSTSEPDSQGEGQSDKDALIEELRKEQQSLRQQLEQLTGSGQEGQGQQAQAGQQSESAEADTQQEWQELQQKYQLQVPEQAAKMLNPEAPQQAKQALEVILRDFGAFAHQQARKEIQQTRDTLKQEVPQEVQEKSEADRIRQDFFGTYPELQDDNLMPLIQQESQNAMQEVGASAWNQQVRDRAAQRVKQRLGKVVGAEPQANGKAQGKKGPGAESKRTGGNGTGRSVNQGSRPTPQPREVDEITNILNA